MRRAGLRRLGLSPLRVRQRRLALSAHAHSTLAKGAHHRRAGLGRKSRHGSEHSGNAAAGATLRCVVPATDQPPTEQPARRRLRELLTTTTLEAAMGAPAIIVLSSPAAASGSTQSLRPTSTGSGDAVSS